MSICNAGGKAGKKNRPKPVCSSAEITIQMHLRDSGLKMEAATGDLMP
jgi:hypothetical protein